MSYNARDDEEDLENLLNKGALWAVTYGDLMSYLMIFFLIMFTFSLKGKKAASGIEALQTHFGGQKDSKSMQRLDQRQKEEDVAEDLQKKFQAKVTEEKILITLSDKVLFDSGSAELKPGIFPVLKDFADSVRKMPNNILVEGHTDNVPLRKGRYRSNFELSMARAYSVMQHLIEKEGIDPKRFSGSGYGDNRPVALNDTPEHRALNRRIEISLIRSQ
jgi:chemotaxis protein MotB